jgi:hypothetical protein
VSIGEVALADFFARVILNREGKLNLLQIVRQSDAAPVNRASGGRRGRQGRRTGGCQPARRRCR